MEIISMPRPMRWVWGSLAAYWLADIINPGFFSIAIMALLMIPVLLLDLYYPPQAAAEEQTAEQNVAEDTAMDSAEDIEKTNATDDKKVAKENETIP